MSLDDINIMQAILEKKKKQELLRKEYKQKNALQDIKAIFLDAFHLPPPDESQGIMEQLSNIVEQVSNIDHEPNVKLLEWSEKKFHEKVHNKISSEIALAQVELGTRITKVKEVMGNILTLYTKLRDPSLFEKDVCQEIERLEEKLKTSGNKLSQNSINTEQHFHALLHTQTQLAELTTKEATIRAKLINIQSSLAPHLILLQKELATVDSLLQRDSNQSTMEGLVSLAAKSAIQLKVLDIALENWDAALRHIMAIHSQFLNKYVHI
jgi:hypothetical protein